MQQMVLGRTQLKISRTGFGGLPIQRIDFDAAGNILNRALDAGVSFIDTARAYTDSEAKIGQSISHRKDEFILATKTQAKTDDKKAMRKLTSSAPANSFCQNTSW